MEAKRINKEGLLWKFYSKTEKKLESPDNYCQFFWTSVDGFIKWIGEEASLARMWLIFIVATSIVISIVLVFPETNIIGIVLMLTSTIIALTSFIVAFLVTMYRIKKKIEAKNSWILPVMIFTVIVSVTTTLYRKGAFENFWADFLASNFFFFLKLAGITFLVSLVTLLCVSIMPDRYNKKLVAVMDSIVAFCQKTKKNYCPPVKLPEADHSEKKEEV